MKAAVMGMIGAGIVLLAFAGGVFWTHRDYASTRQSALQSNAVAFEPLKTSADFEIREVDKRVFIFNRATGQTWRYFINRDDKGIAITEGFAQMSFLEIKDPVAMVPAPSTFDPTTGFLAASPSPSKHDALPSPKPRNSSPSVKPWIDFQPVASPSPAATPITR